MNGGNPQIASDPIRNRIEVIRHFLHQSSKLFNISSVCCLIYRTCIEKKQRFKKGMVQDVKQSSAETKKAQDIVSGCKADNAKSDANANNAYILNAVICQQTFKIVLYDSHHYSENP